MDDLPIGQIELLLRLDDLPFGPRLMLEIEQARHLSWTYSRMLTIQLLLVLASLFVDGIAGTAMFLCSICGCLTFSWLCGRWQSRFEERIERANEFLEFLKANNDAHEEYLAQQKGNQE